MTGSHRPSGLSGPDHSDATEEPPPRSPCDDFPQFIDDELDEARAAAFREHLQTCPRCAKDFEDALQIRGRVHGWKAAQQRRRRLRQGIAAATFGAAAMVAMLPWLRPSPLRELAAQSAFRPIEGRVTDDTLGAHRPFRPRERMMGSTRTTGLEAPLLRLAERGDQRTLALGYLFADKPRDAAELLARLPDSPAVRIDRAAAALVLRNDEEVLELLEPVLRRDPGHAEALWNRAMALQHLFLTAAARRTFDSVAARGERGWSEEARSIAEEVGRSDPTGERWKKVNTAGAAMARGGPIVTAADARFAPGITRLHFYDALRTADGAARLDELSPLAAILDESAGGDVLSRALRKAEQDIALREPLARAYRALLARDDDGAGPLPAADRAALLERFRRADGQPDLLLGAAIETDALFESPESFRAAAARTADPWFALAVEEARAVKAIEGGDLLGAEEWLRSAAERCHAARLEYRCVKLEARLAGLYVRLNWLDRAWRVAREGQQHAMAAHEWGVEAMLLQELAKTTRFQGRYALARAYLDEIEARQVSTCRVRQVHHLERAQLSLDQLRTDDARAELQAMPLCDAPMPLGAADAWAELARFGLATDERAARAKREEVRERLESMRRTTGLSDGLRAQSFELEGRLLIWSDPVRARDLLRDAIRTAGARESDRWNADAQKARGFSYLALMFEAARRGRWAESLSLLAEEAEVPAPGRCAVGFAVDYGEALFAARDASGAAIGRHVQRYADPAFGSALADDAAKAQLVESLTGPELPRALAGCEIVDVLARPPFQGFAGLLPSGVAWRFRVGKVAAAAPPPAAAERRVLIAVTKPPAGVELPVLNAFAAPPAEPSLRVLLEEAATPASVLREMEDATEIQFHAHGQVDLDVSDVSHLVLAPDPATGRWWLTAAEIRARLLRGAPLVTLGACHAAQTAPYMWGPWSLPIAFIKAGARGVFASPAPLSDGESASFFAAVRRAIKDERREPAVALRNARLAYLKNTGNSSVAHVVLFE